MQKNEVNRFYLWAILPDLKWNKGGSGISWLLWWQNCRPPSYRDCLSPHYVR